uniref:Uncharacterized protein n=1 Tax=Glossina brevipalpis TaxID=37001 RepID=A0A1A9WU09_9MUSC
MKKKFTKTIPKWKDLDCAYQRPLPSSPFFKSFSPFFEDDGIKRLERRRDLRVAVGVDVGVGKSLPPLPKLVSFSRKGTSDNGANCSLCKLLLPPLPPLLLFCRPGLYFKNHGHDCDCGDVHVVERVVYIDPVAVVAVALAKPYDYCPEELEGLFERCVISKVYI